MRSYLRGLILPLALLAGTAGAQPMLFVEKCSDGVMFGIDLAIQYCDRALNSGELSDAYKVVVHFNRGQWLLSANQIEKALADFDEAIRIRPEHQDQKHRALLFLTRGNARVRRQLFEQALLDFSEALRLHPVLGDAFVSRGHAWLRKNEVDKAIEDFSEALRQEPANSFSPRGQGIALSSRRAFDRGDLDGTAYLGRGMAYMRRNEHQRAIEDFNEAIRLRPERPASLLARATARSALKEFDLAISDLDAVVRMSPQDVTALYRRGISHGQKKDYERATVDFDEAIRLNPRFREAYLARGIAWSNRNDLDRAIADISAAIGLQPNDPQASRLRESLLRRREGSKAIN